MSQALAINTNGAAAATTPAASACGSRPAALSVPLRVPWGALQVRSVGSDWFLAALARSQRRRAHRFDRNAGLAATREEPDEVGDGQSCGPDRQHRLDRPRGKMPLQSRTAVHAE